MASLKALKKCTDERLLKLHSRRTAHRFHGYIVRMLRDRGLLPDKKYKVKGIVIGDKAHAFAEAA